MLAVPDLDIDEESTFHPPIFALFVVKRPVSELIVVISLVIEELKAKPSLFNTKPAPVINITDPSGSVTTALVVFATVKVFNVRAVILNFPLYPSGNNPDTSTSSPTIYPWLAVVVYVTSEEVYVTICIENTPGGVIND